MPLWARLRRGGENDGAGRLSHGREADGRPGSAQRNATEWEQGPERERKPRVGKEGGPPLSRGRLRVSDGLLS